MSSGRSWAYQVVSAEELRQRELAAANARLARANQGLAELEVTIAAAEATYGKLHVTVPRVRSTPRGDPGEVTRLAVEVEAATTTTRGRVDAAVAEARAREIDRVVSDLLDAMRPDDDRSGLPRTTSTGVMRPAAAATQPPAATQLDAARRVTERLPGDASADVLDRCRKLVTQVGEASTADRGEVLVAVLREEVRRAQERSRLVAQNRAEVERLYRQLDGLDAEVGGSLDTGTDPRGPVGTSRPGGPGQIEDAVASLRGYLRGVALDAPLPAGLADRVERACDAARKAQDRRYALKVTREVLEGQGYALGDDFVTVAAAGGTLLPLAASRRHGVRVREAAGRILFEVVRFDRTKDGLDDVAAATTFCRSVDTMVELAGKGGLDIADKVFVPPSEGRVVQLDQENPFLKGPVPPVRRPQDRERYRA